MCNESEDIDGCDDDELDDFLDFESNTCPLCSAIISDMAMDVGVCPACGGAF